MGLSLVSNPRSFENYILNYQRYKRLSCHSNKKLHYVTPHEFPALIEPFTETVYPNNINWMDYHVLYRRQAKKLVYWQTNKSCPWALWSLITHPNDWKKYCDSVESDFGRPISPRNMDRGRAHLRFKKPFLVNARLCLNLRVEPGIHISICTLTEAKKLVYWKKNQRKRNKKIDRMEHDFLKLNLSEVEKKVTKMHDDIPF